MATKARESLRTALFIDGCFVPAATTWTVEDPAAGAALHSAGAASTEQVDAAVRAAAAAAATWRLVSDGERAGWLRKLADEVLRRKEAIAAVEALNVGKPLREAEADLDDVVAALRYCAGLAEHGKGVDHIQPDAAALPDPAFAGSYIIYEPVGVVAAVLPFNFPLVMMGWKLASALAAGCTIVFKPSEYTPFSALELAAAAEAVGLPRGVLNVVNGPGAVGAALTEHPLVDKLSFTGSVPTGSRVMRAAADGIKRVTLELGGKSPLIVFDDANLDTAIEWALMGFAWNSGQVCSATGRILVQEGIAPEFTRRLVAAAAALKQGGPFEEGVDIGPSANRTQYEKVCKYIEVSKAEGCELLLGGGRPDGPRFAASGGFWVAPTIFRVPRTATIFKEEVFGPVACITTFADANEALELANASQYGLAAAVLTANEGLQRRCARELRAGVVWINCAQPSPHAMPWGGFKKSGIGRELGPLALLPFLEAKAVTVWDITKPAGWYPAEYFTK